MPKAKDLSLRNMNSMDTKKNTKDDYDQIRRLKDNKELFRGLTDSSELKANHNSPGAKSKRIEA